MRRAFSLTTAFLTASIAIGLSACAGNSENGPTILEGMNTALGGVKTRASDPRPEPFDAEGPILLPYRSPERGGIAYRLTLEVEGERASRKSQESDPQPFVREKQTMEAAFRNLPVEGADSSDDLFLVGLDALYYTEKQDKPPAEREIEIADDRLRVRVNGKVSVDNRANRVTGPLDPRIFIGRIFAVITHDTSGNPIKLSSRGAPAARQFMNDIPVLGAIAYAMVSLPDEPITAGSSWTGVRIPPSRPGTLGLSVPISYSLAGFEVFEGVACAMILLNARVDENAVTGVTGHPFDRVQTTLNGTAWVELETSLLRRVVLSDQIRANWSDSRNPGAIAEYRIEHSTKLVLALRDPGKNSSRWSDGTPKFDSH